jgi:hypothetical protein
MNSQDPAAPWNDIPGAIRGRILPRSVFLFDRLTRPGDETKPGMNLAPRGDRPMSLAPFLRPPALAASPFA